MDQPQKTVAMDMGTVLDGTVLIDPDSNEIIIRDSDGVDFPIEAHLKSLLGKEIRFTCIKLESMEVMMNMLASVQGATDNG